MSIVIPDFRGVVGFNNIQSLFVASARSIMFRHELVWRAKAWRPMRITALELYLHADGWKDPNTDRNAEQLSSGKWYVRLRSASRSRMDITAGHENIYCGLLVRGIDGIDGPAKALKRILRGNETVAGHSWQPEERSALRELHGTCIFSGPLQLKPRAKPIAEQYSLHPRIRLRQPDFPWDCQLRIVAD